MSKENGRIVMDLGKSIGIKGDLHRIDFKAFVNKRVTIYGQQEVVKDLVARRLADGGSLLFEVDDVTVHDLKAQKPKIRFRHEGRPQEIDCDYVAGCDGFHGICRPSIPDGVLSVFERDYPFGWLGILSESPPPDHELIYSYTDRGFALYTMRSPTLARLYLQCDHDEEIENWPDQRIWDELHQRLGGARKLQEGKMLQKGITPMRSFVASIKELERTPEVLSIGLTHGFGYSDIAEAGAAVVVVGSGDPALCGDLADRLAEEWFALRDRIVPPSLSIEECLLQAASLPGPVVIADSSDNPGGGAAGDSTHLLRAMLDHGTTDAVFGMLWDPPAVAQAAKAGVGATLPLRLGGKIGPHSGQPLDLEATVLAHRTDAKQKIFGGDLALGEAVAIEAGGIRIVVNSVRQQVVDPACFTALGLDPWSSRYVVVKSAQHFYEHFAPRARAVLYVDAPGVVTNDYRRLPYEHLGRPVWPLDPPPFKRFGREWR